MKDKLSTLITIIIILLMMTAFGLLGYIVWDNIKDLDVAAEPEQFQTQTSSEDTVDTKTIQTPKVVENNNPFNYELDNIPRTQDLPPIYEETSGFYIYEKDVINKYNRRIGQHPYIVEVGEIEGTDIDELEDFMIADAIFNHIILNNYGGE